MKRFFTSQNYLLKTKLSSQQVCDLIANNIDRLHGWKLKFLSVPNKEYKDRTSLNSFEIRKTGSYRTSFLTYAKGFMEEQGLETEIKINVRPSFSAFLFHSFWLTFITVVFIIVLWVGLTRDLMALLFLFILGIILFLSSRSISFRRESEEVKSFLTFLLDNKNVEH